MSSTRGKFYVLHISVNKAVTLPHMWLEVDRSSTIILQFVLYVKYKWLYLNVTRGSPTTNTTEQIKFSLYNIKLTVILRTSSITLLTWVIIDYPPNVNIMRCKDKQYIAAIFLIITCLNIIPRVWGILPYPAITCNV